MCADYICKYETCVVNFRDSVQLVFMTTCYNCLCIVSNITTVVISDR